MKDHRNKERLRKDKKTKFINHEHLDRIGEISWYYGFMPHKSPVVSKLDIDVAKDILDSDYIDDEINNKNRFPLHVEEKISFIRMYHEEEMYTWPQPVMLYFKDPCKNLIKRKGVNHNRYADLEIIGTSGPIAEATLIQTSRTMLAEEKYTDTTVEINSIGDKESIARFTRELTAYYRKLINDMNMESREMFKRSPFELRSSRNPACAEINNKAPRAIDFLTENSRRHLEEVLEYLEILKIPYTINHSLLGNRNYCTETIFTIVNNSHKDTENHILAAGIRYNGLAKRINMKRDIQGVGVSLLIKNNTPHARKPLNKTKRPVVSFIQLGMESKLLSLHIIEQLRKIRVPVYQSLAKDRLGAQVSSVERHHTPYIIVMGKKEAVDRVVIVRHTETHSQDMVSIDDLPEYMKKLESRYWQ